MGGVRFRTGSELEPQCVPEQQVRVYTHTHAQSSAQVCTYAKVFVSCVCVCVCRAWHWGQVSVYNSGGFVQELSRKMEESRVLIEQLHKHQWLDPL